MKKFITCLVFLAAYVALSLPVQAQDCPVQISFTASSSSVKSGAQVTLTWNVTNARTVNLMPGHEDVAKSGSLVVKPTRTSAFSLIAISGAIGLSCSKTQVLVVNVTP